MRQPADPPCDSRFLQLLPANIQSQLLRRNVKRFRGGLVFKAHRLVYHSTLGLRLIKKNKKTGRWARWWWWPTATTCCSHSISLRNQSTPDCERAGAINQLIAGAGPRHGRAGGGTCVSGCPESCHHRRMYHSTLGFRVIQKKKNLNPKAPCNKVLDRAMDALVVLADTDDQLRVCVLPPTLPCACACSRPP